MARNEGSPGKSEHVFSVSISLVKERPALRAMFSAEEEEEEGLGEPLILRIDQDDQGSVGSEDTSRFDSDDDLPLAEAGRCFLLHLRVCSPS